ncbi:MAG: diguanylate cyclase [Campylobacterales bacterium]|nr:diguanylate cyclase [Campylobacterales bacterium]
MTKPKFTFRYRFILAFVTLEVIFLTMIATVNFNSIQATSQQLIDSKAQSVKILTSNALAVPIGVFDLATIDDILESIISIDGIQGVEVRDSNNNLLSKMGNVKNRNGVYIIENQIKIDEDLVGFVKISMTFERIHERIKRNQLMTVYLILFEVLLSVIFSYLIGYKISTNLEKLTDAIDSIKGDSFSHLAVIKSNDEIGVLSWAINNMQNRLRDKRVMIDDNVILSETDLNGVITYASEAFARISGYSKRELIGQSHNIVRHPDMDKEFFTDLWDTIKDGHKWSGEIKNITKLGNTYWTKSVIVPIEENGERIGYRSIREDITDKKIIEEISITDGLTNIYNRRYFNDIFPKIINSSKRRKEFLGLIIMDVDHFKQYNDTYGHQQGDQVLIAIGTSLKENLKRAEDYCFRLGGEEFGIVFKSDDKEHALAFSNKIRQSIEELKIKHSGNSASEYVTVSLGLICKEATEIKSMDNIYQEADEKLYMAKDSGRNQVVSN